MVIAFHKFHLFPEDMKGWSSLWPRDILLVSVTKDLESHFPPLSDFVFRNFMLFLQSDFYLEMAKMQLYGSKRNT